MKRFFSFIFTVLFLITLLSGYNQPQPSAPPENNASVEPSQQGAAWGHLTDEEYDTINTHTVDGGEFVFKEKKYEFQGNNLVIADVKNETENNYTLVVHCSYFDEAGEQVFAESRTYEGWAAGYTQPILFLPMMAFDSYEYSIEVQPYDGVCLGKMHTLEFSGLQILDIGPPIIWGGIQETNNNTVPFYRCATCVLFDNTGKIYGLYTRGIEKINGAGNGLHKATMLVYEFTTEEIIWPANLTGNLQCIIVPYYNTQVAKLWLESDLPKFFPDLEPVPDLFS